MEILGKINLGQQETNILISIKINYVRKNKLNIKNKEMTFSILYEGGAKRERQGGEVGGEGSRERVGKGCRKREDYL